MDREAELRTVYQEALALTKRQTKAIEADDWDELVLLLAKREGCLDQAERLLHDQPKPSNHVDLVRLLEELKDVDAANQHLFASKRQDLSTKLKDLDRSKTALSGYRNALIGSDDAHFIDQGR